MSIDGVHWHACHGDAAAVRRRVRPARERDSQHAMRRMGVAEEGISSSETTKMIALIELKFCGVGRGTIGEMGAELTCETSRKSRPPET